MNDKVSKRGRRKGSSQYPRDSEVLKRMDTLCKQGESISAAAKIAVGEVDEPLPSEAQAIERVRKKYTRYRAEKDAENKKALLSAPPEPQARETPFARDLKQIRQLHDVLRTPEAKIAIEQARRLSKDRALRELMREGTEAMHRFLKK
jgi:hypothetical protein